VDPSVINNAITVAVRRAGLTKNISAHTFRHAFATYLLQRGTDIRTIQPRLGHNDVATTMIDTHILQPGGQGVLSPRMTSVFDVLAWSVNSWYIMDQWAPSRSGQLQVAGDVEIIAIFVRWGSRDRTYDRNGHFVM
jgi:hypothetical protein